MVIQTIDIGQQIEWNDKALVYFIYKKVGLLDLLTVKNKL